MRLRTAFPISLIVVALPALGLDTPVARPVYPSRPGDGVRYLCLIRHGDYKREPQVDDRVGNHLTEFGHEQARLIAQRLDALPVRPAMLVSSDFTRARETADDIGGRLHMKPARDTLLRECTPNSDRPDIVRDRDPASVAACDSALARAWDQYARTSPAADEYDVLVCHGNVIRWFVTRAIGADSRHWSSMDIGNGSLTVISVRADGRTRLVMFSDVGHLPPLKQTWTGRGPGWGVTPAH